MTRSGGGLGESGDGDGDRVVDVEGGMPGNSEATWPSGPTPSITHVERAGAVLAHQRRRTTRRGLVDVRRASAVDGISCTWAGSTPTASRNAARAWPALRSAESAATKRSSPHQTHDPRPVHLGRRRRAGRSRGGSASAMVPPVSAIWGTSPRPARRRAARSELRRPPRWPGSIRRTRGPRRAGAGSRVASSGLSSASAAWRAVAA